MPSVLWIGPYQFLFYSRGGTEPPHIHVRRERFLAKFWLVPLVELADNKGFRSHELNVIRRHVELNREYLLEKWHEHLG
ncbi:MAG: DUF4160 domain-containing protein [Chthoniobacterales bacterium]|nr:DUF4160 domain-containing protein [Chthoniobacterales bacterium]